MWCGWFLLEFEYTCSKYYLFCAFFKLISIDDILLQDPSQKQRVDLVVMEVQLSATMEFTLHLPVHAQDQINLLVHRHIPPFGHQAQYNLEALVLTIQQVLHLNILKVLLILKLLLDLTVLHILADLKVLNLISPIVLFILNLIAPNPTDRFHKVQQEVGDLPVALLILDPRAPLPLIPVDQAVVIQGTQHQSVQNLSTLTAVKSLIILVLDHTAPVSLPAPVLHTQLNLHLQSLTTQ